MNAGRNTKLSRLFAAAVAFAFLASAHAQQPSSKVVRLVLPFPTGPGLIIGQAEFIRKDSAKWARVVREANVKLE